MVRLQYAQPWSVYSRISLFYGHQTRLGKGSLQVKRLEVIPLSELMRPRIDVTARISGLFRDTMPTVVELLDKAVLLAADLNESENDNYIKSIFPRKAA